MAKITSALMILVFVVAACGGGTSLSTPTATPRILPLPELTPAIDTGTVPTPTPVGQGDATQARVGTGVGDLAPDFTVTSIDGETVSLTGLQGKPFVLYFFATW